MKVKEAKRDIEIQKRIATKEGLFSDKIDALKEMRKELSASKKALAMQKLIVEDQKEDLFAEVIRLVQGRELPTSCLRVNHTILGEILGDFPIRGVKVKRESHQ